MVLYFLAVLTYCSITNVEVTVRFFVLSIELVRVIISP